MNRIFKFLSVISLIIGSFFIFNERPKAYVVIDSTLGRLQPSEDVKASLLSNWGNQFGTSYNSGSDFQTYTSLGQYWYGGSITGEYLDVVADYYVGFEAIGPDTIYNYLPYDQNTLTASNLRCGIGDFRNGYDSTYSPSVTDFKVELSDRTYENIKQYQYHIKFKYHQRINPVVKSSTNLNCYFSVGTGKFFLQLKVNNGTLRIGYYNSVFNWSVSDDPNSKLLTEINKNQIITNEKLDTLNNNQKQTNEKLDTLNKSVEDTNKFLKDDTEPNSDISSLGNVQGLLPVGPVDTLLNIPFTFLSVVNNSLSGTCVPLTGTFVFNSTLTIPCFGSMFYDNVPEGLMVFINLIPSAFLLISYFKHLYKKVDRAVSLQSTDEDEWGVL